jgi:hypothetical protein
MQELSVIINKLIGVKDLHSFSFQIVVIIDINDNNNMKLPDPLQQKVEAQSILFFILLEMQTLLQGKNKKLYF